ATGRGARQLERRRPTWRWRRVADRRGRRRHRHGGAGCVGFADGRGPARAPRRRRSGRAAPGRPRIALRACGRLVRRSAPLRGPRARLHGGRVDGGVPRTGPALRPAAVGAVQRRCAVGLRRGRRRGRPVLLPRRPPSLHRPRVLPRHGAPARRVRRFRPSLRHRARSRAPRAGGTRHSAARGGAQGARRAGGGQRALRPHGTPGRLFRGRMGQARARGARHPGARRHRGRSGRRGGGGRRPAATPRAGRSGARELHPRQLGPARALVPRRVERRRHPGLRHLRDRPVL
ncbi:MAG: YpfJ protein, zinc metalloprotease superfamily, partial [uncultured Acetobacteraceae bacterium]